MRNKPLQLGELELAVLEDLWTTGPSDVKAVHRRIGAKRKITLNTIQSTLDRLFRKALLLRDKVSHAFVYRTALSKAELSSRLIDGLVQTALKNDRESMLAAFVTLADRADALSELEAMIKRRRQREQERT